MASPTTTDRQGIRELWQSLPGSAKAGLSLSGLGFFVRVTVERERFVSGEAICEFFDFGAWIIGLVTIVTGIVTLVEARRADRKDVVLGLGLVILAFGVLHVLRAYGAIGSPC